MNDNCRTDYCPQQALLNLTLYFFDFLRNLAVGMTPDLYPGKTSLLTE